MRTSAFDYDLPPELIAQYPVESRDKSRLLVLHRSTGRIEHRIFDEIPAYLNPGDTLVLNETRVIPARLLGKKERTGGNVEVLLLRQREPRLWEALVSPGRRARTGTRILFAEGDFGATVLDREPSGSRILRFDCEEDFPSLLAREGMTPLPPYVRREPTPEDRERYQTVYARRDGSVAAPTAGLHFTSELLGAIESKHINLARIVLHVGWGTFRPVKVEDPGQHRMEPEYYEISAETARTLRETRAGGNRIVAVGTSAVRSLETADGQAPPDRATASPVKGWTSKFIYPPYHFRSVDALVTNFHAPRSTPLLLVSAFTGRELVLNAYEEAIRHRYRFLSYGDAMMIL